MNRNKKHPLVLLFCLSIKRLGDASDKQQPIFVEQRVFEEKSVYRSKVAVPRVEDIL